LDVWWFDIGTNLDRLMLQSSLKTSGPTKSKLEKPSSMRKSKLSEKKSYMSCVFCVVASMKWHLKSIN
jgi:hypothetical protein